MRLLPDQIRVTVVERQPVAFTRHGQQIGLVDANGVLLDMAPATMAAHHYSFPVVTGIDPGDPADSRKARMAVYLRMMAELDADGKHNSEQISEIDLTDPEDARVLMPEQGADILAHFGEDHFLERYERYQAHIAEWRQQYPHLACGRSALRQPGGAADGVAARKPPNYRAATGCSRSSSPRRAVRSQRASRASAKPASQRARGEEEQAAQAKKHAASQARCRIENQARRNPASTTRPATQAHAAAGVAQGG